MNSQGVKLASEFSGPILFSYVWWVLKEAQRLGIHRLYFLARDGYTLKRIAERICEQFQLDISLEYLYCSRMSLRFPTYFFIGEEAYDLLFSRGMHLTLQSVLKRANLSREERVRVYADCGMQDIDETRVLNLKEFHTYSARIRNSCFFRYLVCKKSREAYDATIGYLKQCGLFEESQVAIVDSGWAGSIQRSLRQLMEFTGYTGTITGFYFGIYRAPRIPIDGEHRSWYFDSGSSPLRKAQFSNNLFECLLAAPHGMTIGYEQTPEGYVPRMGKGEQTKEWALAAEQSDAIDAFAREYCRKISYNDFSAKTHLRQTEKLIHRYMMCPTESEAAYYGQFLFCDDITEAYQSPLAAREQKNQLKEYLLVWSLWKRLFPAFFSAKHTELFWPYGTTAFLPGWKAQWWRNNICFNEFVKQMLKRKTYKQPFVRSLGQWKRVVEPYSVVSFDLFDTLLYRTLNEPKDVFRLMEPQIYEQYGVKDFARKRIAAEEEARKRSEYEEVTLSEIYECIEATSLQRAAWMQMEQETERQVLRADPVMVPLFQHCLQKGKKIWIISDMYQNSGFLQKLLEENRIIGYNLLYISCEENASKATCKLFEIAKEQTDEKPEKWIHIGDNASADYFAPRKIGVSAMLFDNGRHMANGMPQFLTMLRTIKGLCRSRRGNNK